MLKATRETITIQIILIVFEFIYYMVAKLKKNKKWPLKSIILSVLLAVLSLGAIVFLSATNWKISQRRAEFSKRIEVLKAEVDVLEEKNRGLKENLSYIESQDYIEQVAREQLDMKKPGEEVVVIQKEEEQVQPEQEEKKTWWETIKSLWTK